MTSEARIKGHGEDAARLKLLIRRLGEVLQHRFGEEHAVTIDYLAETLGFVTIPPGNPKTARRNCEDFLEHHVGDLQFTVVSLARCGYFRPARAGELNASIASLRGRAIKDFRRMQTYIDKAQAEQRFERLGRDFRDRNPTLQPEMPLVLV